jgi:hypothetical protein
MVRVVISRATRVPCFSLTLSTLDLQPTTYRGPLDAFTITIEKAISNQKVVYGVWLRSREAGSSLTSLFVKLFEDLADNLTDALQRLNVLLCSVILLL